MFTLNSRNVFEAITQTSMINDDDVGVMIRNTSTNTVYTIHNADAISIDNGTLVVKKNKENMFMDSIYITYTSKFNNHITNSISIYTHSSLEIDEKTLDQSICDIYVHENANVEISNCTIFGRCSFESKNVSFANSTLVFSTVDDEVCKIDTDIDFVNECGMFVKTIAHQKHIENKPRLTDNETESNTALIVVGKVNIESIPELSLDDDVWLYDLPKYLQRTITYKLQEPSKIQFKLEDQTKGIDGYSLYAIDNIHTVFVSRLRGFEFTVFIGDEQVVLSKLDDDGKVTTGMTFEKGSVTSMPYWSLNQISMKILIPSNIKEALFATHCKDELNYHHNQVVYGALQIMTEKPLERVSVIDNW